MPITIEINSRNFAGTKICKNVTSLQLRNCLSAIEVATDHCTIAATVRIFNEWINQCGVTTATILLGQASGALFDVPAKIATKKDFIDLFSSLIADISYIDPPCFGINVAALGDRKSVV